MSRQIPSDKSEEQDESTAIPKRHPITLENSPEETIRRMRSFPERADKLRENISKGKERRTSSRTQLIIAAMLLLSVLTVGSRGQSPIAQQRMDAAALEKQEQAIVVTIIPVGYSRKADDYVEKLQFKVGEPIRIALEMTNTGAESVMILKQDDLFRYRPQLLKDNQLVEYRKEIIPDLKLKDDYGPSGLGSVITIELEPNKPTGVDYINLSLWYGSLEPGHYQLTLGHRFRHKGQHNQSNTVTFDVVPAM